VKEYRTKVFCIFRISLLSNTGTVHSLYTVHPPIVQCTVGGSGKVHEVNKSEAEFKRYRQCCGSGMFIPDPGSGFFHPGPGAATQN
jgi:hypothetical protein